MMEKKSRREDGAIVLVNWLGREDGKRREEALLCSIC
jgi:hypothetical protein